MGGTAVRSVSCSHVGLVRQANEDSFLDRPDLGLWVVADGMGGATAGSLASSSIVAALDRIGPALPAPALLAEIRARIDSVNTELQQEANRRGWDVTIGSTVAGLVLRDGHFACFWAGDSRVYRYRAGELDQLTRDHSVVQDMVDAGVLQRHEAERHPHASVILRAVGVDETVVLAWVHAPVQPGDIFLLCSDGLTRMVADDELEAALASGPIEQVSRDLLAMVLERGAKDNVTIVLVLGS